MIGPGASLERVLVTGGAGFVGQHLVRALRARGSEVVVLDRTAGGRLAELPEDITLIAGCVTDAKAVREAAAGCTSVFHLAAVVSMSECEADPTGCRLANVDGTAKVVDAADADATVVLAGSCAVYGDSSDGPCLESSPTVPVSQYGESKLAAEQVVVNRSGGAGVSLRLFNIIGAGQRSDTPYAAVVPIFAKALATGQRPVIYGDGEQTRDFVPVDMVVAAFLGAAAVTESTVLNVGTGTERRIIDLLSDLQTLAGTSVEPQFAPIRAGDIQRSLADVSRLEATLGLPGPEVEQTYHAALAAAWKTMTTS